ncbi:hypothetical protein EG68_03640 [Paragonimus skrjabini miyazakii]|uniref:Uncharacterized protein n=1 Tax=Paragonimus skrjabini miyazakii TaxID=59628 RepID=A0A8S9YVV4_9TREM|nr:hypothetical protein EG68_03640 [Paragonimus skrjabini miyazakii]
MVAGGKNNGLTADGRLNKIHQTNLCVKINMTNGLLLATTLMPFLMIMSQAQEWSHLEPTHSQPKVNEYDGFDKTDGDNDGRLGVLIVRRPFYPQRFGKRFENIFEGPRQQRGFYPQRFGR